MDEQSKNRKRRFVEAFVVIIFIPWIIWGALKNYAPKTFEALTGNLSENRNLTEFSFENISEYIDDHVPFRDTFIEIYQNRNSKMEFSFRKVTAAVSRLFSASEKAEVVEVDGMFGTKETVEPVPEVRVEVEPVEEHVHEYTVSESVPAGCLTDGYAVYTCSCGDTYSEVLPATGHMGHVVEESEVSYTSYGYKKYICHNCAQFYFEDVEPKLIDTSEFPARQAEGGVLFGRFDWLFYTGNNSVSYYTGSNLLDDETLASYAEKVNHLKEVCDAHGKKLALMFLPNKEQVYPEYMPTYEIENEYKRTARLKDYLSENTDVPVIYPIEELKAYDKFFQSYYKYDTHWNLAGSFIGTQALYKALGMETTDPLSIDGYWQDASLAGNFALGGIDGSQYEFDREYVFKYKEDITLSAYNNLDPYLTVQSNQPDKENLLLIGDSFRGMLMRYLSKDFNESTYIHRDYIAAGQNNLPNAGLIILEAVERYDSRMFNDIDNLLTMFNEMDGITEE